MPFITTKQFNHFFISDEDMLEIDDLEQLKDDFDERVLERALEAQEWEQEGYDD